MESIYKEPKSPDREGISLDKIILRSEAKALGLLHYFTGKPCSYGHIAKRHTCNGMCFLCMRVKYCGGIELKKKTVISKCKNCARPFEQPKCRVKRDKFCSSECSNLYRQQVKDSRKRPCKKCGKEFIPRLQQIRNTGAEFCSLKCSLTKALASRKPREKKPPEYHRQKQREHYFKNRKRIAEKAKAYSQRPEIKEKQRQQNRAYRLAHPEKMREWSHKRRGLKVGRLPRGTIPKIKRLQKDKCAICRTILPKDYHMDHIIPLSKGGKHEPSNIQLLCPTCNVRKSAKDPINYMQERGFLL